MPNICGAAGDGTEAEDDTTAGFAGEAGPEDGDVCSSDKPAGKDIPETGVELNMP
jgi:hypothetical protein